MEITLLFVSQVALGLWIGAIVFHSAVVAPATFKTLDPVSASGFLRALFPRFFQFGIGCGGVLLLATGGFSFSSGQALPILLTLIISMLVLQIVSLAMVPAINRAKDAGEEGATRFGRLHAVNVLLTMTILVMGLFSTYRLTAL